MLLSAIAQLPGIRRLLAPLRRRRARRRFAHQYAAFFGVYASRAEAETAAPRTKPVGYARDALVPAYAALLALQLARRGFSNRTSIRCCIGSTNCGAPARRDTSRTSAEISARTSYGYAKYLTYPVEFLAAMTAMGYRGADEWEDRVDRCEIPLHPERSLETYAGFYFRRD